MINLTPIEEIETIFERAISSHTIFQNHDIVTTDYIPNEFPYRSTQLSLMAKILSPILHHTRPSNLLLYGKTGTGKTAVTKYILNKLKQTFFEQKLSPYFLYCNIRMCGTEYRTMAELASSLDVTIPFTGIAITEVLSRVFNRIKQIRSNILVVLDEIDYLVKSVNDDLLYQLTSCQDKIHPATLSLIGISNDLQFKEELGARVLSRLSEEEIVFPPYTAQELQTILHQRASLAFRPNSCADGTINLCAALSGSEHGDARRAVDLLRVAGEIAEREACTQISEKHVRAAVHSIDQDRITEALKTLPLHAKLLLMAIAYSEDPSSISSTTGAVYDRYTKSCNSLSMESLTSRRTSALLSDLETLGLISTSIVNYGRYGRTKKIATQIPLSTIGNAFQEDTLMAKLLLPLQ